MSAALKLIYVLTLAVGLFFLRSPWVLAGLALLQLGLWAKDRLDPRMLLRLGRRLGFFFAVIVVSYAFFPSRGEGGERWVPFVFGLQVNLAGLALAFEMALRVTTLVLASTWVQKSGEAGDFARAMGTLRVPRAVALSIDMTLSMLTAEGGGGGGRGGGGGGGGGGRGGRKEGGSLDFAQIRRGDLSSVRSLLRRSLDRAETHVAREVDGEQGVRGSFARDLALVSGVSLAAMGLKMLQVMPGLPVAPGHKNVVLLPLILLASRQTRSRLGGLWAGTTIGAISFFLGYGRYGVLEMLHFMVPGLLADLLGPFLHGRGWWRLMQLMLIGAIMGAGRFAANFMVIVLAGAKIEMFFVYLPMLASQVTFGALSGFVSLVLLASDDRSDGDPPPPGPDVEPPPGAPTHSPPDTSH